MMSTSWSRSLLCVVFLSHVHGCTQHAWGMTMSSPVTFRSWTCLIGYRSLMSRRGGFLNARAWTCCCSCFTMFLCGVCLCVCVYRCKFFVSFWGERLHFQKMNANLYFKFCLLLLVACHCWSFKVQEELRALQGNKKRHLSTFLDLLPAAFQVWANAKTWIVNILNLWYSCYICSVERCSDGFEVHM